MTLNQEIIKYLLMEVQKKISQEEGGYNLPVYKNLAASLDLAYKTNSVNPSDKLNPLSNILSEIIREVVVSELIGNQMESKQTIELFLGLRSGVLTSSLTLNNGMISNIPMGIGLNQDVPKTNIPNGIGSLNTKPGLNTTGNELYDKYLDEVYEFFQKERVTLTKDTSLAAFAATYAKFERAYNKTIPDKDSSNVYTNLKKRYF